jgi:uncharacterized repeat protein (TIGR03803 family)
LEVWQLEERRVPSTLTTLASFNSTNGAGSFSGLVEDSSGNLFGMTFLGGASNDGTVFEIVHSSNTITDLASFNGTNGANPMGNLVEDSNGNLFGTAEAGGANNEGTVFEVVQGSNTITVLASFNNTNGEFPENGLVEDSSGNLFGTTDAGGPDGDGTVFEVAHGSNTITDLAFFNNLDGAFPQSNLVEDSSGNLFGTTRSGGSGPGTVFELAHGSNTITDLAEFNTTNGAFPYGGLVEDSSGNLFGTTTFGGANNAGTVFEVVHGSNTITDLASFTGSNGQSPSSGLTQDSNGNLFGTTQFGGANNAGTVFEVVHGSNTITDLVDFNNTNGAYPSGNLMKDASGNLLSTTHSGGANNAGTVFEIVRAPSITSQPQNATVTAGQTSPVELSAAASGGTAPLSYQWQVSTDNGQTFSNLSDSSGISGSSTATLTLSSFASAGMPEYRVIVTGADSASATSTAATLTVNAAPAIATQPHSTTATVGQAATESFTIADSGGTGSLSVQWQVSTDNGNTFSNLSNGNDISGTTTLTLTVSRFTSAGSPKYRAIVTDTNGVTATSSAATLIINAAASITTQPANQSATTGQTGLESFSVVAANGTGPFTYQWEVSTDDGNTFNEVSNGSGISGATTDTLSLSGSALPASGTEYKVVITDVNGVMVTSTPATLTVNAAPSITTQPQNTTATIGQTTPVSFTIADSGGTGPVSVQWQTSTDQGSTFTNLSDGNGISGSSTTTLTLNNFTATGSAEFQAVLTDANGVTATSNAATLTINPPPDPNAAWLTQVYADFFHRPLDASGQATWTSLLNQGMSRTQVVQLIQTTIEYRTDVVEALYSQLLHRAADQAGLDAYTSFLGNGGTAEQVEAALLGSPEYFQLHGGTNNGFLSAVYQDVLNRALDASGAQTWGALLTGGSSQAEVAADILASLEAQTDQVQGLFTELLHRNADPSGLNGFATSLQQGAPAEQVIASIVGSDEYFARVQ